MTAALPDRGWSRPPRFRPFDLSKLATPSGSFKQSGFGRDRSLHAIDKYMDYKAVWQRFL